MVTDRTVKKLTKPKKTPSLEETAAATVAETATPPAPAPAPKADGVEVRTLEPGSKFVLKGQRYQLNSVVEDVANIMLLESATIKVTQEKTKKIEHGVARMEIKATTLVTEAK